jgi:hypothetical protein
MQSEQPKSDYEFILNQNQKPPTSGGLIPRNLSKPVLIVISAVILMVVLIILGTVLGSHNKKTPGLTEVVGLSQEISRVSAEQTGLKDASVIALATTSKNTLASDQAQFKSYAAKHKIKLDKKKLDAYQNKSVDSQLSSAAQNDNLDSAYITYMRLALQQYSSSLTSAFNSTSDNSLKAILKDSYTSTQVQLTSAPLKQ